MSLRVAARTALRYVQDHTDCKEISGEERLRVRVCPTCGHDRWAVTFSPTLQVFYCFRHAGSIPFIDFVKEQIGSESTKKALEELASYGDLDLTWEVEQTSDQSRIEALRVMLNGAEEEEGSAPTFLEGWSTNWETPEGKAVLDYAFRRQVPPWFIALGRVGYMPSHTRMARRMVFLMFEDGRPVYTVGRAIKDWMMPKYLYPHPDETAGIGVSEYVFNLDLLQKGQAGILCEGPLSALSAGVGGIATLGKTLSDTQAYKIAQKCDTVLQLREEGVPREITEENARKLWARGVFTMTADLEGGDPNDNPSQMEGIGERSQMATKGTWLQAKLHGALFRE